MTSALLRPETPADATAIHELTRLAFLNAPHASHTEQFIVDELRNAGVLSISWVAEQEGEIIGHVAASPVSISDGPAGWFGLGPVSVSPQYQRQGIGSLLMRKALEVLRQQGAAGCVLLGDPAYYRRFGFRQEPALVLPGVPPEYFQAIAFDAPVPSGIVAYHEAFNAAPPPHIPDSEHEDR